MRQEKQARHERAVLAGYTGDVCCARSLLRDEDPHVRVAALRALHRAQHLTSSDVCEALADRTPTVCVSALELVVEMASDVNVDAETACCAEAPSYVETTHYAGAPSYVSYAEIMSYAQGCLQHSDSRVVEVAAWACGEIVDGSDVESVQAVVSRLVSVAKFHEDMMCRESAVAALGSIGHLSGLEAILQGLRDKPAVRRRAVIALSPFDGPEVEAAVARAAFDRDRQVRTAAVELQNIRNNIRNKENVPQVERIHKQGTCVTSGV